MGKAFLERARIILSEVEAAEALAAEARAVPRGRLKINAPVTFSVHALTPRLPEYLKSFAEVSIELTSTNRFVDLIDEGYDLVFRVGTLDDSGLIARPLAPYRLVLSAAPSYLATHPSLQTPADLQQHDCLGFAHSSIRTHWVFDGPDGRVSIPVSSRLIMDSGEALRSAAIAGLGVMLQPSELIQDELKSGRLVEVLPEYRPPTRPFHILHAPDRRMTPKLRSFVDFAVGCFGSKVSAKSSHI
jgi:DNA-binding transcriptional LysR family regulator